MSKLTKPRKNPAALALSRLAAKTMTPEQRSARAKHAVQTRWRRVRGESEPLTLWGLFAIEDCTQLDSVSRDPKLLAWSHDKAELRVRARREFAEVLCLMEPLDYDPRHLTLISEFKPDIKRQVGALRILAGIGGKGK